MFCVPSADPRERLPTVPVVAFRTLDQLCKRLREHTATDAAIDGIAPHAGARRMTTVGAARGRPRALPVATLIGLLAMGNSRRRGDVASVGGMASEANGLWVAASRVP